jgi:uncharacterized membrane protein
MNDAIDRTEETLGRVLTVGSRTSTLILAIGLALALAIPAARTTYWLLTVGLVILILTPIARVAVSVVVFARQREWLFVICTSIVLALLIGGVIVAVGG